MDFGPKLKDELDAKGLKYTFVANSVGMNPKQLNKYLNGYQRLSEVKLRGIALSFQISLKKFGLIDYPGIQSET
jgi:transcriptional regulator with XRE-family HTH domain